MRGLLISFSDYREVAVKIYVDPATTQAQVDSLLWAIEIAKERNKMLWREEIPPVSIIFSSTHQNAGKLSPRAAYSYATFFGSFLGGFIAVQPEGLNTDILSHELCHAILHEKLGWYRHYFKIPTWFDEGLAMQVDYREGFDVEQFQKVDEKRVEITTLKDTEFYRQEEAYYYYLAAKKEVYEILAGYNPGDMSLGNFILQLNFNTLSASK